MNTSQKQRLSFFQEEANRESPNPQHKELVLLHHRRKDPSFVPYENNSGAVSPFKPLTRGENVLPYRETPTPSEGSTTPSLTPSPFKDPV